MNFKCVLFILLCFFLFNSCKKKIDNIKPQLELQSPLPLSNYNLPTSFRLKGYAEDNEKLKYIEIDILDENQSPITIKTTIEIDSNPFYFDELVEINNPLIESGSYFVNVKVFDDQNNFSSSFININLSEIPKELKGLYFLSFENENSNLYFLDTLQDIHLVTNFNGEPRFSVINSKHQYMFIATDQIGLSLDIENYNEKWNIIPYQTPYPFFNSSFLTSSSDHLYVVFGDGRTLAYNKNGQIVNNLYTDNQEWFGEIYVDNDYIISEVYANILNHYIVTYFKNSGIENQRIQISGQVAKILKKQEELFLIIVNNQNSSKLYFYETSSNNIWLEKEMPNYIVHDAVIENELIYMASNSGVLNYNFSTKSLDLNNTVNPVYEIKLETLSGVFWINNGYQIWAHQPGINSSLIYSSSDSIAQMMPYYNK